MGTDKRARQKAGRSARLTQAAEARRRAQARRRLVLFGALGVLIVVAIVAGVFLLSDDDEPVLTASSSTTTAPTTTAAPEVPDAVEPTCPPPEGAAEPVRQWTGPPPTCTDPGTRYTAVFDTTEGEIRVELDTEAAPQTVNNFVFLARWGYYDGTLLHRTDPSIDIIQGGSPFTNDAADPGPGYTIEDEGIGFTYEPGIIAMARTAAPDSAGAQFFFSAGENTSLLDADGSYVVFGRTDEAGLAVLESILALHEEDPASGLGGHPSRDVTVRSVTIEES